MKKRLILMGSVIAIAATSIGGMAFAEEKEIKVIEPEPTKVIVEEINETTTNNRSTTSDSTKDTYSRSRDSRKSWGHCHGEGYGYNEMIDMMKKNGFDEMAKYMEERDFDGMNELMNNLSDEDYKKMIDVMRDSGYDHMAERMEVISREGMQEMHNNMMRGRGHGRGMGGMMRGYRSF